MDSKDLAKIEKLIKQALSYINKIDTKYMVSISKQKAEKKLGIILGLLQKAEESTRITLGYRCRFKKDSKQWEEYRGYECIPTERDNGEFEVLVLKKGTNVALDKEDPPYENQVAWVDEKDLEIVDRNISTNMAFVDWLQEHQDDFCPDCGGFTPGLEEIVDAGGVCKKCDPELIARLERELSEDELYDKEE